MRYCLCVWCLLYVLIRQLYIPICYTIDKVKESTLINIDSLESSQDISLVFWRILPSSVLKSIRQKMFIGTESYYQPSTLTNGLLAFSNHACSDLVAMAICHLSICLDHCTEHISVYITSHVRLNFLGIPSFYSLL